MLVMMLFPTKCCVSKFSYFVEYDIGYQFSKFQCSRLSRKNFTEGKWTPLPPPVLHKLKKPCAFRVKDWDWVVGNSPPILGNGLQVPIIFMLFWLGSITLSTGIFLAISFLLGRRQANLCFHFAGSGENLPDIAKSRDATLDNKLFSP